MSLRRIDVFSGTTAPSIDSDNMIYNLGVNLSNSSTGVLAKGLIKISDNLYLAKTGSFKKPRFSKLEPVIEVICCEVIKLLGISCANYSLKELNISGNAYWKLQKVLCSLSEIFLNENESLVSASKLMNVKNARVSYSDLLKVFNKLDINNMLVVDYLINNTDRHLRNFALIVNKDDSSSRFAPLFDHGFSLGQDIDGDYLEEEQDDFCYVYDECDYAKCYGLTNYSQISNVDFTSVKLDINQDDLFNIIDRYAEFIPSYRVEFIKHLLERRLNYARKIFSKREGIYFRRDY